MAGHRLWLLQHSSPASFQICKPRNSGFSLSRSFCKVYSSGGGGGEDGGDKNAQDALVEIVRLQKGQIEVDEFVKEKAELLKNIADGANDEYQRIADDVNKGLEEIGSKVIESMEADVGELEQEMAQSRAQIEADEREFAEFEKKLVQDRSEGLFFKSLYQPLKKSRKPPAANRQLMEEQTKKVEKVTKRAAKSSSRITVYAALAILLTLTIVEAIATGEELYKVGIYSALLLSLVLQFGYERFFANQSEVDKPKD
ncbi:uncharacterized protein LOC112340686 [Selaginella moellendorffii]|uniref:uncharacterized protein LOC112340686 n=1 Tax=Selaginella moellendorffii TaxID=88036 RepID=UPI000D1CF210|nr:uncharacterized protein LOC112340686 [Selaginella moellendorffii]|eukprot:XP_024515278.1 uncharacterized protein LOC112340686 [Selaginella moellendorffii]